MNRPIAIAICLFITLVLVIVLVFPKYQDFKFLQKEISQKETELQYNKEYFLNLSNLSEELKKYSDNLSKIDFALPSGPSIPILFDFLQKTSSQNGLILKRIGEVTTIPFKEKITVKEYQLALSLSGSYSSFKSFLSSLEKSARLIEVESISFASPKSKEEPFSFSLKIKFHSY